MFTTLLLVALLESIALGDTLATEVFQEVFDFPLNPDDKATSDLSARLSTGAYYHYLPFSVLKSISFSNPATAWRADAGWIGASFANSSVSSYMYSLVLRRYIPSGLSFAVSSSDTSDQSTRPTVTPTRPAGGGFVGSLTDSRPIVLRVGVLRSSAASALATTVRSELQFEDTVTPTAMSASTGLVNTSSSSTSSYSSTASAARNAPWLQRRFGMSGALADFMFGSRDTLVPLGHTMVVGLVALDATAAAEADAASVRGLGVGVAGGAGGGGVGSGSGSGSAMGGMGGMLGINTGGPGNGSLPMPSLPSVVPSTPPPLSLSLATSLLTSAAAVRDTERVGGRIAQIIVGATSLSGDTERRRGASTSSSSSASSSSSLSSSVASSRQSPFSSEAPLASDVASQLLLAVTLKPVSSSTASPSTSPSPSGSLSPSSPSSSSSSSSTGGTGGAFGPAPQPEFFTFRLPTPPPEPPRAPGVKPPQLFVVGGSKYADYGESADGPAVPSKVVALDRAWVQLLQGLGVFWRSVTSSTPFPKVLLSPWRGGVLMGGDRVPSAEPSPSSSSPSPSGAPSHPAGPLAAGASPSPGGSTGGGSAGGGASSSGQEADASVPVGVGGFILPSNRGHLPYVAIRSVPTAPLTPLSAIPTTVIAVRRGEGSQGPGGDGTLGQGVDTVLGAEVVSLYVAATTATSTKVDEAPSRYGGRVLFGGIMVLAMVVSVMLGMLVVGICGSAHPAAAVRGVEIVEAPSG